MSGEVITGSRGADNQLASHGRPLMPFGRTFSNGCSANLATLLLILTPK